MDSINKQQPEDNHEDLTSNQAIEKVQELAKSSKTCFFCTTGPDGKLNARPMNVRDVDDQGNFWFLSANDSHKNLELESNPQVTLFLQGSPYSDFLHLTGTATILTDKNKIDELWMPVIKTWFTEGKDDPRITVIKVTPDEGYYWDNKHGDMIAGVKIMIGAVTGKTLDDSIEGSISV